ncbi:MAG TPA: glycosyltransferase [Terriglobia bacterium]|nr:glycosyltransferase [Terriglobia bacterium]
MGFSLVSTCRNEIAGVERWKADMLVQTRPPDEIIIVDAESNDGTTQALNQWVSEDRRVKVIRQRCSPAAGRNIAIRTASNEGIVSADFGVVYDRDWFREMCLPLEEREDVDAVAGHYTINLASLRSAAARADFYLGERHKAHFGPPFLPSSRAIAYRREVWRRLDGYPEDLTFSADDTVYALQILRAGMNVAYAPKAICYWQRPRFLRDYWREAYNYGRGNGEANIYGLRLLRMFSGKIPFLIKLPVSVLKGALESVRPALQALLNADFSACLAIPLLAAGKTYSYYCGWGRGLEYGSVHCLSCRARLSLASDAGIATALSSTSATTDTLSGAFHDT